MGFKIKNLVNFNAALMELNNSVQQPRKQQLKGIFISKFYFSKLTF